MFHIFGQTNFWTEKWMNIQSHILKWVLHLKTRLRFDHRPPCLLKYEVRQTVAGVLSKNHQEYSIAGNDVIL